MAFKIKQSERKQLDALVAKVAEERSELEDQLAEYNQIVADAVAQLNEKITAYNDAVEGVRANVQDLASSFRDQYENKSENWQNGDNGQAADQWITTLEEFDPTDADALPDFEELEIDTIITEDLQEAVDELADEPQ